MCVISFTQRPARTSAHRTAGHVADPSRATVADIWAKVTHFGDAPAPDCAPLRPAASRRRRRRITRRRSRAAAGPSRHGSGGDRRQRPLRSVSANRAGASATAHGGLERLPPGAPAATRPCSPCWQEVTMISSACSLGRLLQRPGGGRRTYDRHGGSVLVGINCLAGSAAACVSSGASPGTSLELEASRNGHACRRSRSTTEHGSCRRGFAPVRAHPCRVSGRRSR
jgi:hypothetical protein